MAIKKMYAIFDTKADAFLNSITLPTDAEAVRWFTHLINSDTKDDFIAQYPRDYILFRLQDFDAKTGYFDKETKPKELITGVAWKNRKTALPLSINGNNI